jgi:coenzyme F420 biosynthesis associated uncharacterized protein
MAQLVDWDLARTTARTLGKGGPEITLTEAAEVVADLRRLTDEAAGHVLEFAKMPPKVGHHAVRVVDRGDWASTNIDGLRAVVGPLADRLTGGRDLGSIAGAVAPRIAGLQAGTVLAYLSGRVLGQFEVFSADPGELLLVAPNIVEVERKIKAVPRDFRLWVCVHEVTHRVQFTGVPWMRDYFLGKVQEFANASDTNGEQFVERVRSGLSTLADSIRNPDSHASIIDLVQTPAQREIVAQLTSLMTLVEGHAEFVMDGVGPEVIPTVAEIRARFNQRRAGHNPIERAIRRLLGIEMKMRQYADGHKFVASVVQRVGIDEFNHVWDSSETLPKADEIADPDAWVARVLG